MKKISLTGFLFVALLLPVVAQTKPLKENLKNYFSFLPFYVDIETMKIQLGKNAEFKFHNDPNRDASKTIIGTLGKDKNLNPVAFTNQLIIKYSPSSNKKRKNVSVKWSINYKLEDLPSALFDFEKIKSNFKPYFVNSTEKKEIGQQGEQIYSTLLERDQLVLAIRMIEYNNFIHTISIEFQEVWKIPQVQ